MGLRRPGAQHAPEGTGAYPKSVSPDNSGAEPGGGGAPTPTPEAPKEPLPTPKQYPGDTPVPDDVAPILDKWVQQQGSGTLTPDERSKLRDAVREYGKLAPSRLYRGASFTDPSEFTVGRPIVFGPTSASTDEGSALPYAESGSGRPVLFNFMGTGLTGLKVSGRAEATAGFAEEEWVTEGQFYIRKVEDVDGVLHVNLTRTLPGDQKPSGDPIDMEVPDAVPTQAEADVAGPAEGGDPIPDLPGPNVGVAVDASEEDTAGIPPYVATLIQPGDKVYEHPQGAYIIASPDGAIVKLGKDGKPKKTSATAAKLAVGHGGWTPVELSKAKPETKPADPPMQVKPLTDLEPAKAVVISDVKEPELPSKPAPAGSKFSVPMAFNEAPISEVPKYVTDPNFVFQQKVDGIRGQLVVEPGKAPWFRARSGQQLQNASATKVTSGILSQLGSMPAEGPTYTVDGELLNGRWYVFDVIPEGSEQMPYSDRLAIAEAWVNEMHKAGLKQIQVLPTARTPEEKQAIWEAMNAQGGEGVMMKRLDAPYNPGARVNHSLKAKITSTADVMVMERNRGGKENAVIGLRGSDGKVTEIGTVSMQGKEKTDKVNVGDVIEVEYLWAMPGSNSLQQPRMVKKRPDKKADSATVDQLRFVQKDVLDKEGWTGTTPEAGAADSPAGTPEAPKDPVSPADEASSPPPTPAGQPMPYPITPKRLRDVPQSAVPNVGALDAIVGQTRQQRDGLEALVSSGRGKEIWDGVQPLIRDSAAGEGVRTHVAMPVDRALLMLADGRMKSVHEAKTTGGGGASGYVTARRWYESEIMGIGAGKNVPKQQRPIYGYRSVDPNLGGMSNYGRLHLTLKSDTETRSTVTWDDSLNDMLTPIPLSEVRDAPPDRLLDAYGGSIGYHTNYEPDKPVEEKIQSASRVSYIETQIHGGVRLEDIDSVTVDRTGLQREIDSHKKSESYYHPPSEWRKIRDQLNRQMSTLDQVVAQLQGAGIDVKIV